VKSPEATTHCPDSIDDADGGRRIVGQPPVMLLAMGDFGCEVITEDGDQPLSVGLLVEGPLDPGSHREGLATALHLPCVEPDEQ